MEQNFISMMAYEDSFMDTEIKSASTRTEVQGLWYRTIPLSKLPKEKAINFCKQLYSPEERFALGFYRYHKDIMKLSEEEAWQSTLQELKEYIDHLIQALDDPRYHTIGFEQQGRYVPVGLYGIRTLLEHDIGEKILNRLEETGVINNYPGNLAIAHSFSALNGYRNRALMKFAFLCIALDALKENFQHIFFFMSDYRLGPIYKRFGLEFPSNLTFADSKHLVGSYSVTSEHMNDIQKVAEQFGYSIALSQAKESGVQ